MSVKFLEQFQSYFSSLKAGASVAPSAGSREELNANWNGDKVNQTVTSQQISVANANGSSAVGVSSGRPCEPVRTTRSLADINKQWEVCCQSCSENTGGSEHLVDFNTDNSKKKVTFPSDVNLISQFFEARNPFGYDGGSDSCTNIDILNAYLNVCRRHKITPSLKVQQQIQTWNFVPGQRIDSFSLKGEKISVQHMECLEEIFRRVRFVSVDFEYTFLDDDTISILADIVEFYESAVRLNISFNQHIGVRGWQAIMKMVRKTPCVQHLNLRYTSLSDQSVPALARALRTDGNLTSLHLENCSLSGKPLIILVSAFKLNTTVKELYLAENGFGPNDASHLYTLIISNASLQLLDLRNNNLQDTGLSHICDALRNAACNTNGKLTTLVLWNNKLSSQGMPYLSRAILENKTLETLNLGCNNIRSDGVQILKEAIARNRTLCRLGFQATKLTCPGGIAIAECLEDNPVLVRVDLRDNEIKLAGLIALSLAVKLNTSILTLNLDKNITPPNNKIKDYSEQVQRFYDEIEKCCRRNRDVFHQHTQDAELHLCHDYGFESSDLTTWYPPDYATAAVSSRSPTLARPVVDAPLPTTNDVSYANSETNDVSYANSVTVNALSDVICSVAPAADAYVISSEIEFLPTTSQHADNLTVNSEAVTIVHETATAVECPQKFSASGPTLTISSPCGNSSGLLRLNKFIVSPVKVPSDQSAMPESSCYFSFSKTRKPEFEECCHTVAVTSCTNSASCTVAKQERSLSIVEEDKDIYSAVEQVVKDMVNYCVYEVGSGCLTPPCPMTPDDGPTCLATSDETENVEEIVLEVVMELVNACVFEANKTAAISIAREKLKAKKERASKPPPPPPETASNASSKHHSGRPNFRHYDSLRLKKKNRKRVTNVLAEPILLNPTAISHTEDSTLSNSVAVNNTS